jgi:dipeptidase
MKFPLKPTIILFVLGALLHPEQKACTNLLISKGATKDGSCMISYSADSHELYGALYFKAGGVHQPGTLRDIVEWDTGKFLGRIKEAPVTYTRVGNMNEHQVSIGETTFGGRKELADGQSGMVDYGSLMYIVLERARTAREGIQIMADLITEYGYYSSGEMFSLADPNEVWMIAMIGKGKGEKGAVWVAQRLPDGTISAHANQCRIATFPQNDRQNCLYAPDVVSFARKSGFYKGADKDFNFTETYAPYNFSGQRFCEARVYSVFRRAAPSQTFNLDFAKGVHKAEPLPLWIKPDQKLSAQDAMALMRDHFEGTPLDLHGDIGAGPFNCPYRWRPMEWESDGQQYVFERAISTQQTGFSFIAQSRSWLPNPIGGLQWFGVDDTYSTVYVPIYCGVREIPKAFAVETADFNAFNPDGAHWVFNVVSNWAYTRYSDMIVDVQKVQRELEGQFAAETPEIEKAAQKLYEQSPLLARDYLTQYSVKQGEMTVARWRKLGEFLLWKYMDGNVRNEKGKVLHPRYRDEWYRAIVKEKGATTKREYHPGETAE